MPRVSVVIPAYNAEAHLRACLESLARQTLGDIEIICVDDGSTDSTPSILADAARNDSRVRVLHKPNEGAGAARNAGMQESGGDYLSFLDADDLFEPSMLEDLYDKCVADDADIGICGVQHYDTSTGQSLPATHLLKMRLLPARMPFSHRDMPSHILNFTANATWNKLFRRSFVIEHGLRFQEIRRTNDLLFTNLALVKASRITVVDKPLVRYRIGSPDNLQATNDETPLEFYRALTALRDELLKCGILAEVERSFVNEALYVCLYNLSSLRTLDSYYDVYEALKSECFDELGITGHPREYFFSERDWERYSLIVDTAPDAFLLAELTRTRAELKETRWQLRTAKHRIDRVIRSRWHTIGRRIYSSTRGVRRLFRGDA